jgi:hypothetical protein
MNGPKVNEAEKLRREALIRVGDGLRDHYGHVLKGDVPEPANRSFAAPCRTE